MKKIFGIILFFTLLAVTSGKIYAKDIIPNRPNLSEVTSVGLYQVGDDITIYEEPDEKSTILYRVRWNKNEFFPEDIGAENFFVIFMPAKQLALVGVSDIYEGWVEIIYDQKNRKTGWIKQDDPYKFMTWINFYNTYGKKYGLKMFAGAPDYCNEIKSASASDSQTISQMNKPQKINLNIIRGNWALVSVFDLDRTPKTGFIRWRSDDGVRYFFPDLK